MNEPCINVHTFILLKQCKNHKRMGKRTVISFCDGIIVQTVKVHV